MFKLPSQAKTQPEICNEMFSFRAKMHKVLQKSTAAAYTIPLCSFRYFSH